MAEPFTIHRAFTVNGKLLFFSTLTTLSPFEQQQRKNLIDTDKYISVNTGLFDAFGQEIFTGDILSKVNGKDAIEFLVKPYADEDGEPEGGFFLDATVFDKDDFDKCDPHFLRINLSRRNSYRYTIVQNIYRTFDIDREA